MPAAKLGPTEVLLISSKGDQAASSSRARGALRASSMPAAELGPTEVTLVMDRACSRLLLRRVLLMAAISENPA